MKFTGYNHKLNLSKSLEKDDPKPWKVTTSQQIGCTSQYDGTYTQMGSNESFVTKSEAYTKALNFIQVWFIMAEELTKSL